MTACSAIWRSGVIQERSLAAARSLGLPVVMINRPPTPEGEVARSVDQALDWIDQQVS